MATQKLTIEVEFLTGIDAVPGEERREVREELVANGEDPDDPAMWPCLLVTSIKVDGKKLEPLKRGDWQHHKDVLASWALYSDEIANLLCLTHEAL